MKNIQANQAYFDLPSAFQLIEHLIHHWNEKTPDLFQRNITLSRLPQIIKAIQTINSSNCPNEYLGLLEPISELQSHMASPPSLPNLMTHSNEFLLLFDIQNFQQVQMDTNIKLSLGLEPADFNIRALAGLDPVVPLFHHHDVQHVIRWVSIAYTTLTLKIFKWKYKDDQFRFSFRSSTVYSSIKELRDIKYVCLEKTCIPYSSDPKETETNYPKYFLNKISVLPSECFHQVKIQFISRPIREGAISGFMYLLNVMLLGIPIKHLLILHERSLHRNIIEATHSLNKKVQYRHRVEHFFTEKQFADCLQKTIRKRISFISHIWCKAQLKPHEFCNSDAEAVEYAKKLGLLPIPKSVEDLIYRHSFLIKKQDIL